MFNLSSPNVPEELATTTTTTSNSTQTPGDLIPPLINDEILPQSHHQNPGHCTASFASINRMRHNIQLCDVNLEVSGVVINAHKVVLASVSPYFYAMFNGWYFFLFF